MLRVLFILFLSTVTSELHSIQHIYQTRKSRSITIPASKPYLYSQIESIPGSHINFGDGASDIFKNKPTDKFTDALKFKEDKSFSLYTTPTESLLKSGIRNSIPFTDYSTHKYSVDYEIAKAEAKYNSKFLPSKIETDAKYARLRSMMDFYSPKISNEYVTGFASNAYHGDQSNIRVSSRDLYDGWPYFYHTPYEYEHMKTDSERETTKEKRYASKNYNAVIPVHEKINEDIPYSREFLATPTYPRHVNTVTTTDNPISGNQPFFSFVLNDYFNNGKEDDTFVFKGYDWSKEFDHVPVFVDLDEYAKRNRRLQNNYTNVIKNDGTLDSLTDYSSPKKSSSRPPTHSDNDAMQEQDFHKNDDSSLGYKDKNKKNKRFKEFIDEFAKKFGMEFNNKNTQYTLKGNKDKGENKKDLLKVYHNNEYQDKDLNKNSIVRAEEYENSASNIAAKELFSKSQSKLLSNKKGDTYDMKGNKTNKNANNLPNGIIEEKDTRLKVYRNVAQKIALSNDADYYSHPLSF